MATSVPLPDGVIRIDATVPPRAPWSARLEPGEVLRLIDLEGSQAIDFLCYNADDPSECYHAPNTIKVPRNIFIGLGSVLRSNLARPMMTVIADTCAFPWTRSPREWLPHATAR